MNPMIAEPARQSTSRSQQVRTRSTSVDWGAAWIVTCGILFTVRSIYRVGPIRISLADGVLVCAVIHSLLRARRLDLGLLIGSWRKLPYSGWITLLAVVILMGSLVTWLNYGHLPMWTLANRD